MAYVAPGNSTSPVEVTNVSNHGFWLLIRDQEVFLPFENFPWFRNAPIGKILHVELPSEQHLYWPELDVDLDIDSIFHPERYPLIATAHEPEEPYSTGAMPEPWDQGKVDDCVLALLQLTIHDGDRAWKGFDFDVLDRLYQKGLILNPRNKTKSVVLTDEGLRSSSQLFRKLFCDKK